MDLIINILVNNLPVMHEVPILSEYWKGTTALLHKWCKAINYNIFKAIRFIYLGYFLVRPKHGFMFAYNVTK